MASSAVTADSIPFHSLSLTDLHREIGRLTRLRATAPLGPGRDAAIGRMWSAHQERAHRLCLLTLRAGYPLA